MNKEWVWWGVPVLVVALGGGGYYWWQRAHAPQPAPAAPFEAPAAPQTPPASVAEPAVQNPIEPALAEDKSKALPALGVSDSAMREAFVALVGDKPFAAFFQPDRIIRRIVATVDNLPRSTAGERMLPVKTVAGTFVTAGSGAELAIGADNAARYDTYVKLLQAVDTRKAVDLYVHFYPLFQQAYVDLGYPKGYFNDRLVTAIDDMLVAPDPTPPVKLTQPKVLFAYADADLEARSAGQKILMRMGSENAAKVKAKLREFRQLIARHPPSAAR